MPSSVPPHAAQLSIDLLISLPKCSLLSNWTLVRVVEEGLRRTAPVSRLKEEPLPLTELLLEGLPLVLSWSLVIEDGST